MSTKSTAMKSPKKKLIATVKKSALKKKSVSKKKLVSTPVLAFIEHEHEKEISLKPVLSVGTCSNCEHLPMHAGQLVALMSYLILLLSGIVIAQAVPFDAASLVDDIKNLTISMNV